MYKFEKLKVWQESIKLIKISYELIKKLPSNEEKNAADQLRRAVFSITLNIAEGTGSESDKDQIRFLLIARKSLYEVVSIIKILEHLYNIDSVKILEQINLVGRLLNGLIRSLKI